jgi:hypothetical protein
VSSWTLCCCWYYWSLFMDFLPGSLILVQLLFEFYHSIHLDLLMWILRILFHLSCLFYLVFLSALLLGPLLCIVYILGRSSWVLSYFILLSVITSIQMKLNFTFLHLLLALIPLSVTLKPLHLKSLPEWPLFISHNTSETEFLLTGFPKQHSKTFNLVLPVSERSNLWF